MGPSLCTGSYCTYMDGLFECANEEEDAVRGMGRNQRNMTSMAGKLKLAILKSLIGTWIWQNKCIQCSNCSRELG